MGESEFTDEHDVQWGTNGSLPRPCADSFKRRLGGDRPCVSPLRTCQEPADEGKGEECNEGKGQAHVDKPTGFLVAEAHGIYAGTREGDRARIAARWLLEWDSSEGVAGNPNGMEYAGA